MINHFFETGINFDSTEDCVAFATLMLENLRFLYSKADGDNPEVWFMSLIIF
jgi:hypothetical protein